jgi:hypothetical protein
MVVHIRCKCLPPMFHLFFKCILQACLSRCYIYLAHMLQVFCLDVTHVCNGFQVFLQVLQTYVSSILSTFRRMLQALHCILMFQSRSEYCIWDVRGKREGARRGPRVGVRNADASGGVLAQAQTAGARGKRIGTGHVPSDRWVSDRRSGRQQFHCWIVFGGNKWDWDETHQIWIQPKVLYPHMYSYKIQSAERFIVICEQQARMKHSVCAIV